VLLRVSRHGLEQCPSTDSQHRDGEAMQANARLWPRRFKKIVCVVICVQGARQASQMQIICPCVPMMTIKRQCECGSDSDRDLSRQEPCRDRRDGIFMTLMPTDPASDGPRLVSS